MWWYCLICYGEPADEVFLSVGVIIDWLYVAVVVVPLCCEYGVFDDETYIILWAIDN